MPVPAAADANVNVLLDPFHVPTDVDPGVYVHVLNRNSPVASSI